MMTLEPGRRIRGKYRLERELASGGMGALWVAHDRMLRRRVAIKFVHAMIAGSPKVRARFDQEACTTAQIKSPHVVETYDSGIYRGLPFIVLELLEGEDLRTRLERVVRLPYSEALTIFAQILKALAAVHSAGVVHRDLKPGNIFLARIGGEEVVKILDFGVARAVDLEGWLDATRSGQVLGTPKYMSPEQVRGVKAVDARSDLWSVAVILYRVLTGVTPFVGRNVAELLTSICNDVAPPPSQVIADLPSGVDSFFQRAFALEPADRFQSAHEMLGALVAMGSGDFDSRRRAITLRLGPISDYSRDLTERDATTMRPPPPRPRVTSTPEIEVSATPTSDVGKDWNTRETRRDLRAKSAAPAEERESSNVPLPLVSPALPPPMPSATRPAIVPDPLIVSDEEIARAGLLPPPLPTGLDPHPRPRPPKAPARPTQPAAPPAAASRPVEPGRESAEPFPLLRPRQAMDSYRSLPPPALRPQTHAADALPHLPPAAPMRWGALGVAALVGASLIVGAAWLGSVLDISYTGAPAASMRSQGR